MAGRLSRRQLAKYVADRLHAGDQSVINELAALLIEESREREADILARDIEDQLESLGTLVVSVESARPLSAASREEIKKRFDAKDVQIREIIRPSLIGGVKVSTPSTELDQTIATRLKALGSTNI